MASTLEQILASVQGLGTADKTNKASSKSAKELARLNGEIQKGLQKQQAQFAQSLAAQQAAADLAQQRDQQSYQRPFTEAELTGYYNGTKTLAMIQEERNAREFSESQAQQGNQFTRSLEQQDKEFGRTLDFDYRELELSNSREQERIALERDISNRDLTLRELTEAHQDAIARGELDLAREIQTRAQTLEEQNSQARNQLEISQTSGYMQNGQLTEQARAAREAEAMRRAEVLGVVVDPTTGLAVGETQAARQFNAEMELKRTQTMGRDANGNLTDAGQQWRTQSGLEYARTAAQLAANPADYFESAAFMRNAGAQDPMAFLRDINQNGMGSSAGFRSAATGLPSANSMERIAMGQPAPQLGPGQTMPTYAPGSPGTPLSINPIGSAPATIRPLEGAFAANQGMLEGGQTMGAAVMPQTYAPGMAPPAPTPEQQAQLQAKMDQQRMLQQQGFVGEPQAADTRTMAMTNDAGPSPSLSAATAATQGLQTAFTESMNRPLQSAFSAQQTAMDPAQQRLAAFRPTFQAGAHRMAPGAMESMSATEKALFGSAARASGINPDDWDQSYKRSRLQTNVSANAI